MYDDDEMYVDLYEIGLNDGMNHKPIDQDYFASEEYMAGYRQGVSANEQ